MYGKFELIIKYNFSENLLLTAISFHNLRRCPGLLMRIVGMNVVG